MGELVRPSAYRTWLFLNSASAFINTIVFTTAVVLFVGEVGANPLQLVLIGTVMEVGVFVFEIPTGAFADNHGRRASVVVSFLVEGVAFLVVGFFTDYVAVLVGYVIWGIGATFASGALEAWITDEMEGRDLEKVFLRGGQFWAGGEFLGFGASAILASFDLALPFIVGGALSVMLGATLCVVMPEERWHPTSGSPEHEGPVARLRSTSIEGIQMVRRHGLLLPVLGFVALLGMYTESFDRLWEAHMLAAFEFPGLGRLEPVVWFGIIGAVGLILGIVAMGALAARFTYTGPAGSLRSLRVLVFTQLAALSMFALAPDFYVAVAAMFVLNLARGIGASLLSAWLNREIESSRRATVLSIVNQSDAVGQWVGGPAIGAVGTVVSLRWALCLGAAVLVPAIGLLRELGRRVGRSSATPHRERRASGAPLR
jgi:DHA3 family tetracycline resistance protein-like MFS transporter